jgi:hypothetical protein
MYFYGRRMAALTQGVAGVEGGVTRQESFEKADKESVEQVERA